MLRFLLLILVCVAAAVWIEPDWRGESKSLVLRIRTATEIASFVRERARDLGRRAADALADRFAQEQAEPPPVGAGPPERGDPPLERAPLEGITREDQRELDRLVEQTTRER